ncbi:hypothetical protein O9929_00485 [Vibrio lentus]|nr:hypothetical protein [Vibrio lentus]
MFGLKKKDSLTLYHAKGCDHCSHKGYRGRTGIHELLMIDDSVQELGFTVSLENRQLRRHPWHNPKYRDDA